MPALIPADVQDLARPGDIGLLEHIDREALEQRREAGMRLGPRQKHLAHPVSGAAHPRRAGVQPGEKPARVQVTPRPLLGMIKARQLRAALRTRPAHPLGVANHHVDPLLAHRQLDLLHLPRRLDPQKLPVELHIAHRHLPVLSGPRPWQDMTGHPRRCCRRTTPFPRSPPTKRHTRGGQGGHLAANGRPLPPYWTSAEHRAGRPGLSPSAAREREAKRP